jgi:hypothetical protein
LSQGPSPAISSVPQEKHAVTTTENPEEEYFRLLVLSIKILHSEKDPEFGVEVNMRKMYKLVKKEKVPFHRWFFWVNQRIQETAQEQKKEQMLLKQQQLLAKKNLSAGQQAVGQAKP